MNHEKNCDEVYGDCCKDGFFLPQKEVDIRKIRSIINLANADLDFVRSLTKTTSKESSGWNLIYKIHYDCLRQLTDALVLFDKVKSSNHQCVFAYLCTNHQDLELDWNFFEKVRTKRNRMQYYGTPANYNDWKEIEMQMNLYINTLKKELEKKLKDNNR